MSTSEKLIASIIAAVDAAFDRQLAFTQTLVNFDSTRGNEKMAQRFMAQAFAERSLSVDQWHIDINAIKDLRGFAPVHTCYDDAVNVVGTYVPQTETGRSLILNGHIDVVPTGPLDRWTIPPFDSPIDGNWLYGRGSGDMKAGLAATLFAFDAVLAAGYKPCGRIHLQSVVEEECTGNGALACVARGYKADCAFIPEPFGPRLMRAQIGPMWLKLKVQGDPRHASGFQSSGVNAIEAAIWVWERFRKLEDVWNARRTEHPLFAGMERPILFNLGKIAGGDWPSSVPAWCDMEIRVGVYPGWRLDEVRVEIENFLASLCQDHPYLKDHVPEVLYHGFMAEGYELVDAQEPERALRDSHYAVFGQPLVEHVTPAATDVRFFSHLQGTPGIVYGPVCEGAHGFDERVDIDSIRAVTKTIALFIAQWCGVMDANMESARALQS
ncbi:MAG TPA: ArgE/DapE family deacylase [Burkholderiaceae bacterium]